MLLIVPGDTGPVLTSCAVNVALSGLLLQLKVLLNWVPDVQSIFPTTHPGVAFGPLLPLLACVGAAVSKTSIPGTLVWSMMPFPPGGALIKSRAPKLPVNTEKLSYQLVVALNAAMQSTLTVVDAGLPINPLGVPAAMLMGAGMVIVAPVGDAVHGGAWVVVA